jgi:hypothetical protein
LGIWSYWCLLKFPIHLRPYQMEPPSCTETSIFHVKEYKRVHKVYCIPNQWTSFETDTHSYSLRWKKIIN